MDAHRWLYISLKVAISSLFPERIEEQIVDIPVPPIVEEIAEVMSSSHAAAHAAPTPVNEYTAPASTVAYATPAPVIDYVSPSPVIEHITPAPPVTHVSFSEQFSLAYTMTAVATGVSSDTTVAREVTQNIVSTPVCAGDRDFATRWARQCEVLRVGDRHYEGEIRVLHAGENPDDFRSGTWIPTHCFRPDGKRVCIHRRRGWW